MEKREEIKAHLNGVFNEIEAFLGFKPTCYIAGGSIASIVLGETPNDYDVWFELPDYFDQVDKAVTKADLAQNIMFATTNRTKYATTVFLPSGKKVQFVCNRMGHPDGLVPQFDFRHTQSFYTQEGFLSCDIEFISRRCLEFVGKLDHPINTMERVLKFSKRGYFVPSETLESLMLAITKTDPAIIKGSAKHAGSL